MPLWGSLAHLATLPQPDDLSQIQNDLDPDWIEAALKATGTATVRQRRLPTAQVVWLVIGMALFRNKAITAVASHLDLALPSINGRVTAAPSAVSKARGRLGDEPLQWLFTRCAEEWAHASAERDRWRRLSLYGLDGTSLRVPVTEVHDGTVGRRAEAAILWYEWSPPWHCVHTRSRVLLLVHTIRASTSMHRNSGIRFQMIL